MTKPIRTRGRRRPNIAIWAAGASASARLLMSDGRQSFGCAGLGTAGSQAFRPNASRTIGPKNERSSVG